MCIDVHLKLYFNGLSLSPILCTYSSKPCEGPFIGEKDRFNGITVDTSKEKCSQQDFSQKLHESITKWIADAKRCIWFRVNIEDSYQVPILANKGFTFHHARDGFVMMYKWLPSDSDANLPPAAHTNLSIGAIVFNDKDQILAVSEKQYEFPHCKLPGGYVEVGEDLTEAAVREVKEETGVDTVFQYLITFLHTHNMMHGNSEVNVLVMMKALSDQINISQREVNDCKWMHVTEYTNHPHVHEFSRLVVNKALQYKNKNFKLDLQKKTVKWSTFVRDMTFLTVEDFD
ncbi:uncharacterized protein ACR2FA_001342 [Aphomia sociella]